MKKLVFVIQLIFLYSGLAMADPVISLKTLLHEMTDRSVLARWPENAYTCKQFSSYDRSSHNMTGFRVSSTNVAAKRTTFSFFGSIRLAAPVGISTPNLNI